ncbi:MAG TPA: hypothetical protein VNB24_09085 [Acidimicrobiales bacterium]|nr:hypothetical protein [Acidimicrobiales bacterium]
MRRWTVVAVALAFVVVTAAVAFITSRLRHAENVEWISWWLTVGCAYVGLGLVTWWVRDRDRAR